MTLESFFELLFNDQVLLKSSTSATKTLRGPSISTTIASWMVCLCTAVWDRLTWRWAADGIWFLLLLPLLLNLACIHLVLLSALINNEKKKSPPFVEIPLDRFPYYDLGLTARGTAIRQPTFLPTSTRSIGPCSRRIRTMALKSSPSLCLERTALFCKLQMTSWEEKKTNSALTFIINFIYNCS